MFDYGCQCVSAGRCLDSVRVVERERLNPVLQVTSDRTDLYVAAVFGTIVGILATAATGSLPFGITLGSSVFLCYLLTRNATIWVWPSYSWNTPVVMVPSPRRNPVVVVNQPVHQPNPPLYVRTPSGSPSHTAPQGAHATVGGRRTNDAAGYVPSYDAPPSSQPGSSSHAVVGGRRT